MLPIRVRPVLNRCLAVLGNVQKFPSTIFQLFADFSWNIDPRTYIARFFSIWTFRLLNMSQIRWLRPSFMTFFSIPKLLDETTVFWDHCSESIVRPVLNSCLTISANFRNFFGQRFPIFAAILAEISTPGPIQIYRSILLDVSFPVT